MKDTQQPKQTTFQTCSGLTYAGITIDLSLDLKALIYWIKYERAKSDFIN